MKDDLGKLSVDFSEDSKNEIKENLYFGVLIDGHHKATACYLEGKTISGVIIGLYYNFYCKGSDKNQ